MSTVIRRLKSLVPYLTGKCVVLMPNENELVVDAGKHTMPEIRSMANTFMKEVYLPIR